ncbi:phosphatase PAP2 family protein, partial [Limobrevibacterium gyesilva]
LAAQARWRARPLALAALCAATIGATRMALKVHTMTDVAIGAAIGVAGALLLARLAGDRPAAFNVAVPLGVGAAVIAGFHGLHMPAEAWLRQLAGLAATP